jgi:uncharacterized protein with GYD domain
MLWASFGKISQEGIKGIITEPQNRAEPVGKLVEALGGKLISYHLLLNAEIDFFIITEMPDDKSAEVSMINAMLVRGSGAIESIAAAMAYKAPTRT